MTVTVEAHHGSLEDVKVQHVCQRGDSYARMILLALQSTGKIVQFGIVRIHLQFCDEQVRHEILAENKPLGRILIEHDVLRRIEPTAFLRITPGPVMMKLVRYHAAANNVWPLALIHCNDQPAVELLEIVAPANPGERGRQPPDTCKARQPCIGDYFGCCFWRWAFQVVWKAKSRAAQTRQ